MFLVALQVMLVVYWFLGVKFPHKSNFPIPCSMESISVLTFLCHWRFTVDHNNPSRSTVKHLIWAATRFPTMWYVRPAKAQTSLRIRAVWSELLLVAWIIKLLIEQHLEFLSLKGGCTGSCESSLVTMPHCWESTVTTHFICEQQRCRPAY